MAVFSFHPNSSAPSLAGALAGLSALAVPQATQELIVAALSVLADPGRVFHQKVCGGATGVNAAREHLEQFRWRQRIQLCSLITGTLALVASIPVGDEPFVPRRFSFCPRSFLVHTIPCVSLRLRRVQPPR